jgi:hypothetical protein
MFLAFWRARVDTILLGCPGRLSWRHRARPSATLHEIQACPLGANLNDLFVPQGKFKRKLHCNEKGKSELEQQNGGPNDARGAGVPHLGRSTVMVDRPRWESAPLRCDHRAGSCSRSACSSRGLPDLRTAASIRARISSDGPARPIASIAAAARRSSRSIMPMR